MNHKSITTSKTIEVSTQIGRDMRPYEFSQKYGKSLAKRVLELAYAGALDEFIEDLSNLNFKAKEDAGKYVLVPTASDASELHTKHDHLNIIVLGGLVTPYKGVTLDMLNVEEIEKLDGEFLVIFNDSPESSITINMLRERFPNKVFIEVTYGLSAVNPFKTDEYTQRRILRAYMIEQK